MMWHLYNAHMTRFINQPPLITLVTSPAGVMAKYCDEHVCVCPSVCLSVCLSDRERISGATRAIFTKFLWMLPMAVVRSSSGMVTKSQMEWAVLGFPPHWQCIAVRSLQKGLFHIDRERWLTGKMSSRVFFCEVCIKGFPILDTERWARSWSRCTGSQPAGDRKSSTRR